MWIRKLPTLTKGATDSMLLVIKGVTHRLVVLTKAVTRRPGRVLEYDLTGGDSADERSNAAVGCRRSI